MAGKRQHFIPQFLQQGFATTNAHGKSQTWVFRRNTAPFRSNIANVGVEGRFYTHEDDNEADNLITIAESEFSALVRDLRANASSALSDPKLPQLIAHLEARTRHLRENLLHVGNIVVSEFLDFMSDEDAFAEWLVEKTFGNPALMRKICAQEIASRQLPAVLLEPMVKASTNIGPQLVSLHKKELRELANMLRPKLTGALEEQVKSAHVRALKQSIAPQKKVKMLSNVRYAVCHSNEGSLILGDSVVCFKVDGDRAYKTFLEKKDSLKALYMPLDSNSTLVGSKGELASIPENLREILASCSLEHFIAAENSKENKALQNMLGTNAFLLTGTEMTAIMREVLKNVSVP